MSQKACGPHVELASNPAVRVTRCPCGTVHVTLAASGVTVRMNGEALKNVAAGLGAAIARAEEPKPSSLGSTSIN